MPAIPAKYRRWLYAVGVALVPVLVAFGWVEDSMAPAIIGLVYTVFMGSMAAANTPKGGDDA